MSEIPPPPLNNRVSTLTARAPKILCHPLLVVYLIFDVAIVGPTLVTPCKLEPVFGTCTVTWAVDYLTKAPLLSDFEGLYGHSSNAYQLTTVE